MFLSIICCKCGTEDEKIFKVEDSVEVLKNFGIFNLKIWLTKIEDGKI